MDSDAPLVFNATASTSTLPPPYEGSTSSILSYCSCCPFSPSHDSSYGYGYHDTLMPNLPTSSAPPHEESTPMDLDAPLVFNVTALTSILPPPHKRSASSTLSYCGHHPLSPSHDSSYGHHHYDTWDMTASISTLSLSHKGSASSTSSYCNCYSLSPSYDSSYGHCHCDTQDVTASTSTLLPSHEGSTSSVPSYCGCYYLSLSHDSFYGHHCHDTWDERSYSH